MDWATRHVLAWRLSNTMDASFCVQALDDALGWRAPEILNTDQGSQFTSEAFADRVLGAGVRLIANIVPCGPLVFRKACNYDVIQRIRAVFTGSLLCRYVPYCTIVYPSICDTQVGRTACANDPLRPPSWRE